MLPALLNTAHRRRVTADHASPAGLRLRNTCPAQEGSRAPFDGDPPDVRRWSIGPARSFWADGCADSSTRPSQPRGNTTMNSSASRSSSPGRTATPTGPCSMRARRRRLPTRSAGCSPARGREPSEKDAAMSTTARRSRILPPTAVWMTAVGLAILACGIAIGVAITPRPPPPPSPDALTTTIPSHAARWYVTPNQAVRQGDVLATLDGGLAEARLACTEAAFEAASSRAAWQKRRRRARRSMSRASNSTTRPSSLLEMASFWGLRSRKAKASPSGSPSRGSGRAP